MPPPAGHARVGSRQPQGRRGTLQPHAGAAVAARPRRSLGPTRARIEQTWQPARPPAVEALPVNVFGEIGDPAAPRPPAAVGEAGFQQHTYVDEGEDADVAVDPTGKWLAFASTRHSDRPTSTSSASTARPSRS